MGNALGLDMRGLSGMDAVDKVVDAVKELSISVGIPQTLQEIGIPESALEKLAHQAIGDVCTSGNPRKVTEKDILQLYKEAYK